MTVYAPLQLQDALFLPSLLLLLLLLPELAAPLLVALKRRTVQVNVRKGGSARLQVVARAPGKCFSLIPLPA